MSCRFTPSAASALIVVIASAAWAAAAAEPPRLGLLPSPVKQGQSVLLVVEPGGLVPTGGHCEWNGKQYPLYLRGSRLEAFLPVTYAVKPGGRAVAVVLTDSAGKTVRLERTVAVKPTDFGEQRLRLSKKTQSLYTYPGVEEERRLIGEAKARRSPVRFWGGRFLQPCPGRISTRYGLLRYINGKPQYRHRGVDIAAPRGTPVRAAEAGTVALARTEFRLHGKTVVLDHGHGVCSLYIHMDAIDVKVGDIVERGRVIGRVGSTGASTGPHLHWGLYVQGEAVDPLFWTHWDAGAG